jgi:hypothetical protein
MKGSSNDTEIIHNNRFVLLFPVFVPVLWGYDFCFNCCPIIEMTNFADILPEFRRKFIFRNECN